MPLIIVVAFLLSMGVLSACMEWRAHGVIVARGWAIAELLSFGVVVATLVAIFLRFIES